MSIQVKKLSVAFLLMMVPLLAQVPADLNEIKRSLICSCDCNMTVAACEGAMSCGTAKKLNSEAIAYIEQGMSKDEILDTFVRRYGEQILAAPTKKGFNLVAWILPFAVLGTIGIGIVILIRKWVEKPSATQEVFQEKVGSDIDRKYEQRLDEVLREME